MLCRSISIAARQSAFGIGNKRHALNSMPSESGHQSSRFFTIPYPPISDRCPVYEEIRKNRRYSPHHHRPCNEWPKIGPQNIVCVGKGERLPCDVGGTNTETGYFYAEPQAKSIEGNHGPGIIHECRREDHKLV